MLSACSIRNEHIKLVCNLKLKSDPKSNINSVYLMQSNNLICFDFLQFSVYYIWAKK